MRTKLLLLLLVLIVPTTLLAQDDWRDRRPRDDDRDRYSAPRNAVELTPFAGYTWGGTIFARETSLFRFDTDAKSNPNLGLALGIPVGDNGMKLELMATRQPTELEAGGGLFDPDSEVADIDITYFHAGVQIPFAQSRNAMPFFVVSAGLANLDPDIVGVSAENRFSASAGVGVKLPLSRNLGVRIEGRGYYTQLEDTNDDCSVCDWAYNHDFYQGQVNFGLVFSF